MGQGVLVHEHGHVPERLADVLANVVHVPRVVKKDDRTKLQRQEMSRAEADPWILYSHLLVCVQEPLALVSVLGESELEATICLREFVLNDDVSLVHIHVHKLQ
jgi:hypothetical protein